MAATIGVRSPAGVLVFYSKMLARSQASSSSAANNTQMSRLCTNDPAYLPPPAAADAAAALGARWCACGVCGGGDACRPLCVSFCVRNATTVVRTFLSAACARPPVAAKLAYGTAVMALAHGKSWLLAELCTRSSPRRRCDSTRRCCVSASWPRALSTPLGSPASPRRAASC
jgi:hypothetical protein